MKTKERPNSKFARCGSQIFPRNRDLFSLPQSYVAMGGSGLQALRPTAVSFGVRLCSRSAVSVWGASTRERVGFLKITIPKMREIRQNAWHVFWVGPKSDL